MLTVALATAGLLAASVTPALAAPDAADARMMTEKDVPASFGTPKSRDFDAKTIGKTIGIKAHQLGQSHVDSDSAGHRSTAETVRVSVDESNHPRQAGASNIAH